MRLVLKVKNHQPMKKEKRKAGRLRRRQVQTVAQEILVAWRWLEDRIEIWATEAIRGAVQHLLYGVDLDREVLISQAGYRVIHHQISTVWRGDLAEDHSSEGFEEDDIYCS